MTKSAIQSLREKNISVHLKFCDKRMSTGKKQKHKHAFSFPFLQLMF